MKKQHLHLSEGDRTYLEELVRQGELPVKVYRRAIGLLELDRGKTYTAVAKTLGVNPTTVSKLAQKYQSEGLACLQDQARSGRPVEIDGVQRARVTALAAMTRLKAMSAGPCACWPTKRLNWAMVSISHILKLASF
jgi:transposase